MLWRRDLGLVVLDFVVVVLDFGVVLAVCFPLCVEE